MPSKMDFERSSGEAQWLDSEWFDASRTGNTPELPAAFPEQTPAQAKALRREKFLVGACLLVALAGSVLALVACTGEPFEQDMERITDANRLRTQAGACGDNPLRQCRRSLP